MDSSQLTLALAMERARGEFADSEVVSRIDGGIATHTYGELFQRVDRLAWALRSFGIKPGDRVGTLAWNHHRHLEIYLAATLSGAVLHTINLRLSTEQAVTIASHAGDQVVFVDADARDMLDAVISELPDVRPVVRLGAPQGPVRSGADAGAVLDYETLLAEQPATAFPYPELSERMPAATSYSSATTGAPKGVVYSHRALVLHSMMLALQDTWGLGRRDTVLPIVPMYHVNAWGLPFTALWMGSRLVLPGCRPTGRDVLELLTRQRVTLAAAVPTVWMDVLGLLRTEGAELPELRLAVCGGAPLHRSLLVDADSLGVPMVNSYGMTEASPLVAVGQSPCARRDADPADAISGRMRQGSVVPGVRYRVVDASGAEVPGDGATAGELLLSGPWVAEEYERDARTESVFVEGWYRTGDIVTVDREGRLQVVDRAADVIKSGGEWISSVDLENALMDHPSITAAAVVGVPDTRWQERPCAYIVSPEAVDAPQVRDFLAERFPKFWLPDQIVRVDRIPLTSAGKIDKAALRRAATR